MIGGISYFHEFAYDLLAENERILASTFDAAIAAHRDGHARADRRRSSARWCSSRRPSSRRPRAPQLTSPPPLSTYGFQKLASEYFAQGAWEQYRLPYTIVRPFNCVGIGERRALRDTDVMSGNVKLAMSHVVPDLVAQDAQGPGPAAHPGRRAARCATTRTAATWRTASAWRWSPTRRSTRTSTSRRRRRRRCSSWPRRSGARSTATAGRSATSRDPPFEHDVQLRVPDVRKARDVLGFEATTRLDAMLDEVIPWIRAELEAGRL